jgi:hypothetical protein
MMCSMCPELSFGDKGNHKGGWICPCGELNCTHYAVCPRCRSRRYDLEQQGLLKDGRPVGGKIRRE